METNEMSAQSMNGIDVIAKPAFSISDEELKAFYLKESVVLLHSQCSPTRTEYELLCILKAEYKQILNFFTQLNVLPWGGGTVYGLFGYRFVYDAD